MPKVLNKREFPVIPDGAVYIGRPSKWGNPFSIGVHGDRIECVRQYKNWIMTKPELMASLGELRGKDLVCWCSPLLCHGDVLIGLANL